MVQKGEADLAQNIQQQDATDPAMDVSYPTGNVSYLRIDTLKAPLDDARVRLALNYAFDRQAVLESVMNKGTEHATQLVLPIIPGHNFEIDKMVRQFDPEKAKALLAEAKADGVPVDTEIVLISRPNIFPGAGEVAEIAFEMFRAVGLNVKLQTIEEGQVKAINDQPYAEDRQPALFMSQHDNLKGDPVFSMGFKYSCEGRQSQVCIADLDKMILSAAALQVGPERVAAYEKLIKHIYEDVVPEVWLFATVGNARINPRIKFEPNISTGNRIPLAKISFN
jgi:peptide/nickel transport system substrate-binding protein